MSVHQKTFEQNHHITSDSPVTQVVCAGTVRTTRLRQRTWPNLTTAANARWLNLRKKELLSCFHGFPSCHLKSLSEDATLMAVLLCFKFEQQAKGRTVVRALTSPSQSKHHTVPYVLSISVDQPDDVTLRCHVSQSGRCVLRPTLQGM